MTLTFTAFHVENAAGCYYDGVALFDGGLLTDPQLGGPYCGNTNPGVVESYQNIVLFIFYSDYTIQYGGFSVIVTFNPPPTPPPPAPSTTPTTTTSPTPNIGKFWRTVKLAKYWGLDIRMSEIRFPRWPFNSQSVQHTSTHHRNNLQLLTARIECLIS